MIDWARVEELRNDLGADGFDEVIELFLEEMEDRLQMMQQPNAICTPDDLHFLKGCSANVGFSRLLAICTEHESRQVASVDEVNECYEQSKVEFLARVSIEDRQMSTPDRTSSSVMSR